MSSLKCPNCSSDIGSLRIKIPTVFFRLNKIRCRKCEHKTEIDIDRSGVFITIIIISNGLCYVISDSFFDNYVFLKIAQLILILLITVVSIIFIPKIRIVH